MTPNLLVLNGNPKPDSLCHALAREYARSAEQRGARVTLHHVGELASRRIFTMAMTRRNPSSPICKRCSRA
ncbi:NAD(P)H-dependent oxidoreductase [Aeromonas sp. R7-1]|uniref:NAD(P)H-dependent oxidoreductase n=1 Tax=Aeromonas sp. R7-1 TaxID=3138473 RepID=UPI0034A2CC74